MVGEEAFSGVGYVLSIIAPVVIAVTWVEKRFRDSDKNSTKCVEDALRAEREQRTSALNAQAAEFRNTSARLERMAAGLNTENARLQRDMTALQLQNARDLRDFPTNAEMHAGFAGLRDQINKLEARFENVMGLKRRE